jgi:hypothetical protein
VLDPSPAPAPSPSRAGRRPRKPRRTPSYRGPHAAAGPYEAEGRDYEVRLERVPGGLRLAAWSAGSILRAAPVLNAGDLGALLVEAAEHGILEDDRERLLAVLDAASEGGGEGVGASPGRSGELRDELRVEALEGGRVRLARWIDRPNSGWELQEAPVMLPASRYAEALERAATAGALASG